MNIVEMYSNIKWW